jgi:hypothetical protein
MRIDKDVIFNLCPSVTVASRMANDSIARKDLCRMKGLLNDLGTQAPMNTTTLVPKAIRIWEASLLAAIETATMIGSQDLPIGIKIRI